jgi:hypothetical protein
LPPPTAIVAGQARWQASAIELFLLARGWRPEPTADERKRSNDGLTAAQERRAKLAAMSPEERAADARQRRMEQQRERYRAMTPEQRQAFKATKKLGLLTDERDLVDFAAEIAVPAIAIV